MALAGITYKYNQCHTTLGRLSSVCVKLEPASSKNKEILEIMSCKNLHRMLVLSNTEKLGVCYVPSQLDSLARFDSRQIGPGLI